ncbi:MAG: replication initiator protein [Microviridae sp.]|nr:MAG: replication initiator protein [Microviridae sp.]
MPCFKPLDAWRDPSNPSGKLIFSYNAKRCGSPAPDLKVPCGQCVGCRLERSRQWAIRCVHEASLHKKNCFITLTYNDEHLPENSSLDYRVFQLFMKRLRKKYGDNIRFYMCGEYGENFGRPHFHACLFNHDFSDKKLWKTVNKMPLFRSAELEELWPFGFSSIGSVTFESAAYVARYIMKKITGEAAEKHYTFRRPFNRGDILPPSRIYQNVSETRSRRRVVRKVPF